MAGSYKPYFRFHVDEVRFDGNDWLIAFSQRNHVGGEAGKADSGF